MISRHRLGPGSQRLLAQADAGGVGLHDVMALLRLGAGAASVRLCNLVGGGHLVKARVQGEPARWFTSAEAARAHELHRRPLAEAAQAAGKRARRDRRREAKSQAARDRRAERAKRAAARAQRLEREKQQQQQAGSSRPAAPACVPGGFAAAGIGRYLDE
jgi:hypothetical protein